MGIEDRDWYRDAQKERARRESHAVRTGSASRRSANNSSILESKWRPFVRMAFWLIILCLLFTVMNHYLKPKPLTVSASGDLVIARSLDGHFYVPGSVNGKSANFLVDTGASLVTVSERFASVAELSMGIPTTFKTANGDMPGRIVSDVPISVGPLNVSGVRIGVGLVGHDVGDALLGQSFLSKFEIVLAKDQMILRKR